MTTHYTEFESPLCPIRLTSDGTALTGIYLLPDHRHAPTVQASWQETPELPVFVAARAQLCEYLAGERQTFALPLVPAGTAFQQQVWAALGTIPYGATLSYGALAERIGNPKAVRAVGLANGRNPLSIIVPCHRVIGADGSLTGYGGGIARKQALLALERGFHLPLG